MLNPDPEQPPPSEDDASDEDDPSDDATTSEKVSPTSAKEDADKHTIGHSESEDSLNCWDSKNPPTAMVKPIVTEKYQMYTKIKLLPKAKRPKSKTTAVSDNKSPEGLSLARPVTYVTVDKLARPVPTRSLLPEPSKRQQKSTIKTRSKLVKCKREKAINISGGREKPSKSEKSTKATKGKAIAKSQVVAELDGREVAVPGQTKLVANSNVTPKENTEPLTDDEMEDLNDELTDLNTSMATLGFSYDNVVRSLTSINNRREEKAPTTVISPGEVRSSAVNNSTGQAMATIEDICGCASTDYQQKYNLGRFVDGRLRSNAFTELFSEVKQINSAMACFSTFFNSEGYFRGEAYKQSEVHLNRVQYGQCLKVIKVLSTVVTAILKAYNEDRLSAYLKGAPRDIK